MAVYICHRYINETERGHYDIYDDWNSMFYAKIFHCFSVNPLTAKLFNLNFHLLKVVSRWRDPQLQVSENYSDLTKCRSTVFKYYWLMSYFIFNMFKRWYLIKMKTRIYAAPAVKGLKRRWRAIHPFVWHWTGEVTSPPAHTRLICPPLWDAFSSGMRAENYRRCSSTLFTICISDYPPH